LEKPIFRSVGAGVRNPESKINFFGIKQLGSVLVWVIWPWGQEVRGHRCCRMSGSSSGSDRSGGCSGGLVAATMGR